MHIQIALLSSIIALGSCIPIEKWQRSSDSCPYYIETQQNFNWYQAWEECINKNMTLLAIDTLYKQEQIDNLIKRIIGKNITVWMAGHDNALDQRYVWASTGKIFSFTNWAPGQPNKQANDHCIFIHDSTNQWHDFPCSTKLGFICEDLQCTGDKYSAKLWKDSKKINVTILNSSAQSQ